MRPQADTLHDLPTDLYDPRWAAIVAANPSIPRSVGGAAAGKEAAAGGDPGTGGDPAGGEPTGDEPGAGDPAGGEPAAGSGDPDAGDPPKMVDWRSNLKPETAKAVNRYKTPADIADAYVALRANMDGSIRLPGADATPEDVAKYRRAIGVPETPEEYGLAKPEGWPEDVPFSDERLANAATKMQEIGLTPTQAAEITAWYNEDVLGQYGDIATNAKAQVEAAEKALRESWGAEYEANLGRSERAFNSLFGADVDVVRQMTLADGTRLGSHPLFAAAMLSADQRFGEAESRFGSVHNDADRQTLADELASITADEKYDTDPALRARATEITERLYGTEKIGPGV